MPVVQQEDGRVTLSVCAGIPAGTDGIHPGYAETDIILPGYAVHIIDIIRTGNSGFAVHIRETVGSVRGVGYAVLVGDI